MQLSRGEVIGVNDRIRELRKALRMTQGAFGARLGVMQSTITDYERGFRNPSRSVQMAICREFNVSEEWLLTGAGEMFNQEARDELDELLRSRGLGKGDRAVVEKFLELDPAQREQVMEYLTAFTEAYRRAEHPTTEEFLESPEGQAAFLAGFEMEAAKARGETQ